MNSPTPLRELVDILLDEHGGSTSAPCYYSGSMLGGDTGYLYCGFFTALDEADLLSLAGGACPAEAGVPQTFSTATGAPFEFVGYRIRLF